MDQLSEATGRRDREQRKLDCRFKLLPRSRRGSVNTRLLALTPNQLYLRNGPHVSVLETHGTTSAVQGAQGPARRHRVLTDACPIAQIPPLWSRARGGQKGFRGSNLVSTSPETFHCLLPSGRQDAHWPRSQWDLSPIV